MHMRRPPCWMDGCLRAVSRALQRRLPHPHPHPHRVTWPLPRMQVDVYAFGVMLNEMVEKVRRGSAWHGAPGAGGT